MEIKPKLLILIHAEEEFDWDKPVSRENRGVSHVHLLKKYQSLFERYNASVAYALTYPVLKNEESAHFFKEELSTNKSAHLGIHCHPWVTPPFLENVNNFNSYPCNLSYELEMKKLEELALLFTENIGFKPKFYVAGRYGVGASTYRILKNLRIKYDFSFVPTYDYRSQDGPDFTTISNQVVENEGVVRIPHSAGFSGWLSESGERPLILDHPLVREYRLSRLLSLFGGVGQAMLSPEGNSLSTMKNLTKKLIKQNVETLVLSFHSTSICPGMSPYTKNQRDEKRLYYMLDKYLDFITSSIGCESFNLD
jgi:hypothetical protein